MEWQRYLTFPVAVFSTDEDGVLVRASTCRRRNMKGFYLLTPTSVLGRSMHNRSILPCSDSAICRLQKP